MEASPEVVAQRSEKGAVRQPDEVRHCQALQVEVVPSAVRVVLTTQAVLAVPCLQSDRYPVLVDVVRQALEVAEAHLVLAGRSVVLLRQVRF